MQSEPANIYESGAELDQEADRLRDFDLPTQVSLKGIGELAPGFSFLDIGAGANTSLGSYIRAHGGTYTAFDRNEAFLERQRASGVTAVQGDARKMPFNHESFDITHARFVLAHLGVDKQGVMRQIITVTKPGGRAIFIDFDWTTAHGSDTFNRIRDLFMAEMLFDAAFGSRLEAEVRDTISIDVAAIKVARYTAPKMSDYAQVLSLRKAATTDLMLQHASPELIYKCASLFDQLETESKSSNPEGFYFPDFVTVIAKKA
jgi:SAM-dependent methyltransferase